MTMSESLIFAVGLSPYLIKSHVSRIEAHRRAPLGAVMGKTAQFVAQSALLLLICKNYDETRFKFGSKCRMSICVSTTSHWLRWFAGSCRQLTTQSNLRCFFEC